jgi:hypothetical protein
MEEEYDFSQGVRGKIYHPDAEYLVPIYLESDVAKYLHEIAKTKNISVETLVNMWLRQDIGMLQERIHAPNA